MKLKDKEQKCTCYRIVDGFLCQSPAKYKIDFNAQHIGFACGVHARAYTSKSLIKLEMKK